MEDQYGMADLRQFISSRPLFPPIPQPPDLISSHRGLNPPHPYDMLIFRSDSTTTANTTNAGGAAGSSSGAAPSSCFGGFENGGGGGGDGGTGRWPRQETLTLLEIRSRLDPKFKEANQKGPLWDEVSRIMSEEHGYQRSGKKCREKFENLYKYYKKTKEGKAGRQDGKHYRFFRQLEALYGETNNSAASVAEAHLVGGSFHYNFPNKNTSLASNQEALQGPKLSDTSLSLSNYSDADTSSSDNSDDLNEGIDDNDSKNKKRRGKRNWKVKIRDFIDVQMKKLMDKQEAWMEKMMRTIEQKEQERLLREDEWRKQDAARIEREHKFWASERAWIESRDAALMDALQKLTGKELRASPPEELIIRSLSENQNDDGSETMTNSVKGDIWPECEITRLIHLRTGMEVKFQQRGVSEEMLWEEIATKMACFGHDRSGLMCKEKWDSVNNYLLKCNKKRKENSKSCTYYQSHESISNQGGSGVYCDTSEHGVNLDHTIRLNDHGNNSSPNTNTANPMSDSCFRYFMGDAYGRIMD
ncbi:Trihelix transcription factor PTL [Sesamum angolense]|uniref:Trihelix transcription factor PTL n=1 Tax=Sesamum angolense TaxID=2727404 RepID=A0AAE1WND8_9LAMI|nr:Trihelix transcription factor PTL [Sesamum angolense]